MKKKLIAIWQRIWPKRSKAAKNKKKLSQMLYMERSTRTDTNRRSSNVRHVKNNLLVWHKRIARFMSPKVLYVSASIALIGVVIGILFFSRFFVVTDIILQRNTPYLPHEKIEESLQSSIGQNILFVDTAVLEKKILSNFPNVKQVQIRKLLPRALQVKADAYDVIGMIKEEKSKDVFFLTENGTVVRDATLTEGAATSTGSLLMFEVPSYSYEQSKATVLDQFVRVTEGTQMIERTKMEKIDMLLKLFQKNFQFSISKVEYLPLEEEVHIHTDKGFEILFWLQESIETQLFKLKWKLEEPTIDLMGGNIEYVDLRIKDRVDVCEKGTACASYRGKVL